MNILKSVFILIGFSGGLACGVETSPPTPGAGGKAEGIHPTGEENLGRIVLKLPNDVDTTQPIGNFSYRGSGLHIGKEKRFTSGTGCVEHSRGVLGYHRSMELCNVSIAAPSVTTFDLAGLRIKGGNTNTAVDFGPEADFRVLDNDGEVLVEKVWSTRAYYHDEALAFWHAETAQGTYAPLLPATFQLVYSPPVLGEKTITTAAGQILDLDITPPDNRATIKVHAPVRELPDATSHCMSTDRHFLIQRNGDQSETIVEPHPLDATSGSGGYTIEQKIVAFHAFTPEADMAFSVYPFLDTEAPMHYEYVLNNTKLDLSPLPGKTVDIEVQRLDIFHPIITREDGSTYEARGFYRVLIKDGAAWKPMTTVTARYSDCSGEASTVQVYYHTGTGIDLLPGEYKVSIDFSSEEGAEERVYLCSGVPLSCSQV